MTTPLFEKCRQMLRSGASTDEVLVAMRHAGHSQIESIQLLMELTGTSLHDAKKTVHTSSAWNDARAVTDKFHERLEQSTSITDPDDES
jgi:ribosomal protein L7/L12